MIPQIIDGDAVLIDAHRQVTTEIAVAVWLALFEETNKPGSLSGVPNLDAPEAALYSLLTEEIATRVREQREKIRAAEAKK